MQAAVRKYRIRIRRLNDIPVSELRKAPLAGNLWAWSRPHVAEELDRLEVRAREAREQPRPRQIHLHPVEGLGLDPTGSDRCDERCLHIDAVPADEPKGKTELEREETA